jgi:hypothetical protein
MNIESPFKSLAGAEASSAYRAVPMIGRPPVEQYTAWGRRRTGPRREGVCDRQVAKDIGMG